MKGKTVEFWILAALAVYAINIYLPAILYLPTEGIARHVGPRDDLPPPGILAERARKSLINHKENLPIFLALAFLILISDAADLGQAILGAQLFVAGRLAYMPLYIAGIPWLRSGAFIVSFAGLIVMVLALL